MIDFIDFTLKYIFSVCKAYEFLRFTGKGNLTLTVHTYFNVPYGVLGQGKKV